MNFCCCREHSGYFFEAYTSYQCRKYPVRAALQKVIFHYSQRGISAMPSVIMSSCAASKKKLITQLNAFTIASPDTVEEHRY